jgi:hypothetical protein
MKIVLGSGSISEENLSKTVSKSLAANAVSDEINS